MSDPGHSVPPPSSPAPPTPETPEEPRHLEATIALEAGRGSRGDDRLVLDARSVMIEHGRIMRAPLRLALGLVKVAAVDPGPVTVSGQAGRFPILHRLSSTTVIPREEGIDGWLWTSTGGTALTNLGADDEAPNAALVFTKPLDDVLLRAAFDPEFLTALAARSALGTPAVLGVLFRVGDTGAARNAFKRWGFQDILTDREVPPVQRRHLPSDRPADPTVRRGNADAARARTSVAPPGF